LREDCVRGDALIVGKQPSRTIAQIGHFIADVFDFSIKPAARRACGAFSVPGRNAAALEQAPIKAIFFG